MEQVLVCSQIHALRQCCLYPLPFVGSCPPPEHNTLVLVGIIEEGSLLSPVGEEFFSSFIINHVLHT